MAARPLGALVLVACAAMAGGACSGTAEPAPGSSTPMGVTPPASTVAAVWRTLAHAPTARTEVAAAAAGGRIYVAGGLLNDGATVPIVEAYDPASDSWQRGPDLPVALNHAMAATAGEAAFIFGGYRADGSPNAGVFRLEATGWRAMTDMPDARAAGIAVALDGRVFVVGGIAGNRRLADNTLIYDIAADRWSAGPGLLTPREHLGGAGFDGRVYAVGGRRSGITGTLPDAESYDPRSGRWSRLADLPTPRGGLAAATICSGHVVAVGGEAQATFPQVEAFDVRQGTWRALPGLPTPRHGLGVVAIETTVYALAGGPKPGRHVSDTVEAIDLAALGGAC